ncbi:MAG: biosynthetic-type acetolactate synthase large subunit [Bdellovibrionota bacterium]
MKISGSEAIMRTLVNEGVDTIFGYPGGAIMPAYDALYDFREQIRHVLVRHEQGATHAAEGYARITGRAGVCLVTSGPGATNLVTGIADAMLDSVPMVCITGQVHRALLGTDAFQETDVMGITMPVTKWNYQITEAEEIPRILSKAFFIAQNGRPGPVLVDITKNAQVDLFDYHYEKVTSVPNFDPLPEPDLANINKAAELINGAKKPYLLIGHGVLIARAQNEVLELSERAGIPMACTLHGLSAIPTDHPNYVGMLGMHGNYGPNVLTNAADVIIAVGMRFDDRVTGNLAGYAPNAAIVHIDIDAAEIDKNMRTSAPLIADAKSALEKLLPLIEKRSRPEWFQEFARCMEQEHASVIEHGLFPTSGELKMSEVINRISERTAGEAVVVADVGQHQMMAARYYKFKRPDSFITSGGLGTMGFALPAAMGAKIGAPNRPVICVAGDGSFQMTLQELGTISQEQLPVKIVILNNNFLGMVRQWQELFFDKRYSFVDMHNPDFVMVAAGFGIPGRKVSVREELEGAIQAMLETKGPYLLEVVCEKEQNVFPMVPAGASVTDCRLE